MKNSILITLVLFLGLSVAMQPAFAGSATPAAPVTQTQQLSKKELKKQAKLEKRMERLERFVQKRIEKASKPGKKSALDPYLKKAITYGVIAVVLSAIVWIPILGLIAAIVALVFWILALIQLLKWLDTQ